MPNTEKRFFKLDRSNGWRDGACERVTLTGDQNELRLKRRPATGRPLFDLEGMGDGDFAGLSLPTGLAEDGEGRVYILDAAQHRLRRFDPCNSTFETLPCIGGPGSQPRQVQSPHGLAISARGDLYVADTGNRRVQVFNLEKLYLRDIWGPLHLAVVGRRVQACPVQARQTIPLPDFHPYENAAPPDCTPCLTFPEDTWEPWDIAVGHNRCVYVTDRANSLIHRFNQAGQWTGAVGQEEPGVLLHHPTHLAIDRQGQIYVVQEDRDYVLVLTEQGHLARRVRGPEELAGLFAPAAVAIDQNGNLCVSDRCTRSLHWYERERDSGRQAYAGQSAGSAGWASALVFSRDGDVLELDAQCRKVSCVPVRAALEPEGRFYSQALDSRIYRCAWHRIALEVSIPAGGYVQVDTFTSESPKTIAEITGLEDERWDTRQVLTTVSDNGQASGTASLIDWDCLVQSPRGRYLWLRLTLSGDGLNSPLVRGIRVDYPRVTALDFLPAVFQEDPESAHFLEEFLSITGTISDSIGVQIERMAELFDPLSVPDAPGEPRRGAELDFLAWLGSWLGLTIERHWQPDRQRMLIAKAHQLFKLRGTAEGLRLHLSIYTGLPVESIQVLEHYRTRRWNTLDGSPLSGDNQLWGRAIINRLQIGENSQVGAFQLIDTQDPLRDPFHVYAHQFTVFLPWQPRADPAEEQTARDTVRRIVEASKPAHTLGHIQFITSRFSIGEQTLIGLDTVLGAPPEPEAMDRSQLGSDTVLAPAFDEDQPPFLQIGTNTRLGTALRLD